MSILRKSLKILLWLFIFFAALPVVAVLLLRLPVIQSKAARSVASYLSDKTDSKVTIGKIDISFLKTFAIEDFYIEDYEDDTLIFAHFAKANLSLSHLFRKTIFINSINLENVVAFAGRSSADSLFNYNYILEAFSDTSSHVQPEKEKSEWTIDLRRINVNNVKIRYSDEYEGMNATVSLEQLNLLIDKTDLEQLLFEIDTLLLTGLNADVVMTKQSSKNQNEPGGKSPEISLKSVLLSNIQIDYSDSLSTQDVNIDISDFNINNTFADLNRNIIRVEKIYLTDSRFGLNRVASDSSSKETDKAVLPEQSNWQVEVSNAELQNNSIAYNINNTAKVEGSFDFDHIQLDSLTMSADSLLYSEARSSAIVNKLTAGNEYFSLKQFETKFRLDDNSASVQNLIIRINNSSIDADLKAEYPSLKSLKDSLETLILNLDIRNLAVQNSDAVFLSPELAKMDFFNNGGNLTRFSGIISGPLSDLAGIDFFLTTASSTSLKTNFKVRGLPDFEKAYFDIRNISLQTGSEDIRMMAGSAVPGNVEIPDDLSIQGNFHGSVKAFNTHMDVISSFGSAEIKGSVDIEENFNAAVAINDFDIGRLLKDTAMFGPVSMSAEMTGQNIDPEKVKGEIFVDIQEVQLNNYTYNNLSLAGKVAGRSFDGNVSLDDENAVFDLSADLSLNPGQEHYQISLNMPLFNMQKLNFTKDQMIIGLTLNADLSGKTTNELNGRTAISNLAISTEEERYSIDSLLLEISNEPGNSKLSLKSPVADINYRGTVFAADLSKILLQHFNTYFPLQDLDSVMHMPAEFEFEVTLYDHPVLRVLQPSLTEFIPGPITGSYNSEASELKFNASIERISFGTTEISNVGVDVNSDNNELNFNISGSSITNKQFNIENLLFEGNISGDKIFSSLSSLDENKDYKLLINSLVTKENENLKITLDPGNLFIMGSRWEIPEQNFVMFGKDGYLLHDFTLSRQGSAISIVSANDRFNDDIKIDLNNFDLEVISGIFERDTALIKGVVDGSILLKRENESFGLIADATVNNLVFGKASIGNLNIFAENPTPGRFDIDLQLSGDRNNLSAKGYYVTQDVDNQLNINALINSLSLETIQVFSMGALTEASGIITGELVITGNTSFPVLNGSLIFNNATITPSALNNRLHLLNEKIDFKKDAIHLDSFNILDDEKNKATLNGTVKMNNFSDFTFALQVNANNFLLFNTTQEDNEAFFGRLNIDIDAGITGPLSLPIVKAKLKMNEDSYFTFSVPEKKLTAGRGENVVRFENPETSDPLPNVETKQETGITGFDITSVVEIDEQATLRVLLDPTTNDSLVVRGEAALSFNMDAGGKMSLTGLYNVNEGSYVVSLESLIKREFDIKKGSSIIWNGEPMDATVSIDAVYSVRASPIDLVADQMAGISQTDQDSYKQRYPFEVILKLRGDLLSPELSFEIQLDPENKGILGGSVNAKLNMLSEDPSALNKQVFALLVLGRFIQENPLQTDAASSTVRSTLGKFLSDQLNQWSSKLVPGVELNFDIQSYNEYQTGEAEGRTQVDVGVKKQLFNERLSVELEGGVDVEGERARQNSASDITSDVTVEYKLTEDGRFRLRGFRHNNYEGAIEGQIIETGAGIMYVRDFNRWKYFFRKRRGE